MTNPAKKQKRSLKLIKKEAKKRAKMRESLISTGLRLERQIYESGVGGEPTTWTVEPLWAYAEWLARTFGPPRKTVDLPNLDGHLGVAPQNALTLAEYARLSSHDVTWLSSLRKELYLTHPCERGSSVMANRRLRLARTETVRAVHSALLDAAEQAAQDAAEDAVMNGDRELYGALRFGEF